MTGGVTRSSLLIALAAVVMLSVAGCSTQQDRFDLQPSGTPLSRDRTVSTVAEAVGPTVAVYASPGDASPSTTLDNPSEYGVPLVFLATSYRGDWIEVLVPVRPNGMRGWLPASSVDLTQHNFRVRVELGKHRLTVWRGDDVIMDEPVGVGKAKTPTPKGLFYTTELLKPPDPNGIYGAFAFGLSGYSDVLHRFRGGEGELGIHGTTNARDLGRDVSHGCVRLSNEAMTRLAGLLPLGTPVFIGD